MAIYLIGLVAVIYLGIGIDNFRQQDYPHGWMWLFYSLANVSILFYELQKRCDNV